MTDKFLKCLGVVLQYNPLTVAPGALVRGDNIYNRRENVIEPRRGYKVYATHANDVKQYLKYQNRVIAHQGTKLSYDDGDGTFADYSGDYSEPSSNRIRSQEAFSNLYMTTSLGIKVLTDIAGTAARSAGAPRALDPSYTLTGASGFLADDSQCAYRCLIKRTDANSNVIRGYPSQRLWVTNSAGGSRNVVLTTYLPAEAIAGDIIEFYRTDQVTSVTEDTSGDEMGLVYQYELVSGDISAGFVQFTDSVTDALIGATLYTSPSQEGIGQANDRPPLAKDVALYKSNWMFYANTQTKQRLFVTLVGTSGLSGKSITLGGVTYEFGASEIISGAGSPQANVSATGVASVDIDLTARSLVRVINRYASNTSVYAYYLTGPSDLPGQIMIEERGVGASAFTIQSEDTAIGAMFFPAPPVSPATNSKSTSSNTVQKNAVYYSKNQQPEHVPGLNYLLVGPSNKEILRVICLRDSAIVIKEEGVYRITGENPQSFTVVLMDPTVFCKAIDSVVVLANQAFMLSNQGVVAISESGVQVISREIEPKLTPLLQNSSLSSYTAGMAYESERSYFLSTIALASDTAANQTWVYNVFTRTWVRHSYAFKAAMVEDSADKMYFSKPADEITYIERKEFSNNDYADPESEITITSISGDTVEFTTVSLTPDIGFAISQGTTEIPIKTLTTIPGGYRAVMQSTPPSSWAAGAATLYPHVGMDFEWLPWTGQAPGNMKQVSEVGILTDDISGNNTVTAIYTTFRTNLDEEEEEVRIDVPGGGWGSDWGSSPWGDEGDSYGYRTYVPPNKQYCTRLRVGVKHRNARERIVVLGCAFAFSPVSEDMGR